MSLDEEKPAAFGAVNESLKTRAWVLWVAAAFAASV